MKEIDVAIEWWAKQLAGTDENRHDNGDLMQSAFANFLVDKLDKPTEEQLSTFKQALRQSLTISIRNYNKNGHDGLPYLYLDVDYNPGMHLRDAANAAKISDALFPFKTSMRIEEGKVIVSKGYRGKTQILYLNNAELHHPLQDALYNLPCPVCDSKVEFTADFDADGTTWRGRCCGKKFKLTIEQVRITVGDIPDEG